MIEKMYGFPTPGSGPQSKIEEQPEEERKVGELIAEYLIWTNENEVGDLSMPEIMYFANHTLTREKIMADKELILEEIMRKNKLENRFDQTLSKEAVGKLFDAALERNHVVWNIFMNRTNENRNKRNGVK